VGVALAADAAVSVEVLNASRAWEDLLELSLTRYDSENTRTMYRLYTKHAMAVMGALSVDDLTPAVLMGYRSVVMSARVKLSTRAMRVKAVRAFVRWLDSLRVIDLTPDLLDRCLPPVRERGHDIKPILLAVDANGRVDESPLRELLQRGPAWSYPMLAFLAGTGARSSECRDAVVEDFRLGSSPAVRIRGKGGKVRTVPLDDDVADLMRQHLDGRVAVAPTARMFGRDDGGELRVYSTVREAAVEAVLDMHVTPHTLRRTYACRLHLAGTPLPRIKYLLGHAHVETTMRYLEALELMAIGGKLPRLPLRFSEPRGRS
jgi:integrase/recombinase XerD